MFNSQAGSNTQNVPQASWGRASVSEKHPSVGTAAAAAHEAFGPRIFLSDRWHSHRGRTGRVLLGDRHVEGRLLCWQRPRWQGTAELRALGCTGWRGDPLLTHAHAALEGPPGRVGDRRTCGRHTAPAGCWRGRWGQVLPRLTPPHLPPYGSPGHSQPSPPRIVPISSSHRGTVGGVFLSNRHAPPFLCLRPVDKGSSRCSRYARLQEKHLTFLILLALCGGNFHRNL